MSQTDGIGTWVWNENADFSSLFEYNFNFVSNNVAYSAIKSRNVGIRWYLDYATSGGTIDTAWTSTSGLNQSYDTIDIKTAPPVEFLTILQLNAEYQSGGQI